MVDVFLDTSAVVAYINKNDMFHTEARKVIDSTTQGLNFFINDIVLLETQYLLWRTVGTQPTVNAVLGLIESENIRILSTQHADIKNQLEIFTHHPKPSFDSLICAVMHRENIRVLLSYDKKHFDDIEFLTRIETVGELDAHLKDQDYAERNTTSPRSLKK